MQKFWEECKETWLWFDPIEKGFAIFLGCMLLLLVCIAYKAISEPCTDCSADGIVVPHTPGMMPRLPGTSPFMPTF